MKEHYKNEISVAIAKWIKGNDAPPPKESIESFAKNYAEIVSSFLGIEPPTESELNAVIDKASC